MSKTEKTEKDVGEKDVGEKDAGENDEPAKVQSEDPGVLFFPPTAKRGLFFPQRREPQQGGYFSPRDENRGF
jgi:hypothetical protein